MGCAVLAIPRHIPGADRDDRIPGVASRPARAPLAIRYGWTCCNWPRGPQRPSPPRPTPVTPPGRCQTPITWCHGTKSILDTLCGGQGPTRWSIRAWRVQVSPLCRCWDARSLSLLLLHQHALLARAALLRPAVTDRRGRSPRKEGSLSEGSHLPFPARRRGATMSPGEPDHSAGLRTLWGRPHTPLRCR